MGLFSSKKCDICGNGAGLGAEKLGKDKCICKKCIKYCGGFEGMLKISPRTVQTIREVVAERSPKGYVLASIIKEMEDAASESIQEENGSKYLTVKGIGMKYHLDNILSFAVEKDDYGITKKEMVERELYTVYKYKFPVESFSFEFEPDNPVDKNAIKILADGVHVAYVKKGSCAHIRNLINDNRIEEITGFMYGGECKVLDVDGDSGRYVVNVEDRDYKVKLKLLLK